MAALTFLQMLTSEVARMQTAHPERLGELAQHTPSFSTGRCCRAPPNPETGQVLSSDGQTRYTVNGTCDCQAGQHGKGCKHLQAWKLYQYISRKVEAQPTPPPLPEAPASANCHILIAGRQVQITLRDTNETRLLQRLAAVLQQYPVQTAVQAPTQPQGQGKEWCSKHGVAMKQTTKEGRSWWSHKTADGWCKGR